MFTYVDRVYDFINCDYRCLKWATHCYRGNTSQSLYYSCDEHLPWELRKDAPEDEDIPLEST